MEALYFSYGTNINPSQIEAEFQSPRVVGIARLDGVRFAFTRYSPLRGGGVMDILPDDRAHIWGVLYAVRMEELEVLDRARPDYRRVNKVVLKDGDSAKPLEATLYEVIDKAEREFPPTARYKTLLVEGARKRGLPEAYVERLEAVETVDD